MIELKNCPICNSSTWKSLDHLRNHQYWYDKDLRDTDEPVGMKICLECGFVTYDYVELDKLQAHYDRERPVMNAGNITTCNRKNEYHKVMIRGILAKIDRSANILDVGCAQGSFLNMLKSEYGFMNVFGTEWSKAFANFGKYEYGLNITQEIDLTKKYDLISYYHVLEHIQWPDKELSKIHDILTDDGYLYIAVPLYLEQLEESSGSLTNDFENLYHLNHVNVFSRQALKNLLSKCGFSIIKENDRLYGYTVLCKKTNDSVTIVKENTEIIESKLLAHRNACMMLSDYVKSQNAELINEALKHVPDYPDAYILKSLTKDNMKDFAAQKQILLEGLKACPDNIRIKTQLGKLYFQWDENTPGKQFYSNNIKAAEKIFYEVLEHKPGHEDIFYFLSIIESRYKGNKLKAVDYMKKCIEINPMKFAECYNLIAQYYKEL